MPSLSCPSDYFVGCCTQSQLVLKPWWKLAGFCGMRRLGTILARLNPQAYGDTVTHFPTNRPLLALTIDDGLVRSTDSSCESSMTHQVLDLLAQYKAHATFFVCTDYVQDQEDTVRRLLDDGHELGNHLQADKLWYYPKLEPAQFQAAFQNANDILDDLEQRCGNGGECESGNGGAQPGETQKSVGSSDNGNNHNSNDNHQLAKKTRWFRAPQGIMTKAMREVVNQDGNTRHVLGDCYCDDWCFAQEIDPLFANDDDNNEDTATITTTITTKQRARRERIMKQVADIMLSQAQTGSIAILHMPEKGFRQGNLLALEYFLQGVQERGWQCVNLSQLQALCSSSSTSSSREDSVAPGDETEPDQVL